MNTLRFNRHELFTSEMLSETSSLILDVEMYLIENKERDFDFVNKLYGLYDGFLYDDLTELASKYPIEIYVRVNELYNDVYNLITQKVVRGWTHELL